jgi:hypothetical protein
MEAGRRNIVVKSIGSARPRIVVAIAHGLAIPIDQALRAIYRAPAVLVRDIEPALADRLTALLADSGLETEITGPEADPAPSMLFDVALHLLEPASVSGVAEAVADFCACDTARALSLMTTPPGVILGSVGAATVEALRGRLPAGAAELIVSNPLTARYVLIHSGQSPTVRSQLGDALAARGLQESAAGDLLCTDLGHSDAEELWAVYGRTGAVRIVNRDFLRFEIWLEGILEGVGSRATRAETLTACAGIPTDRTEALIARAPFVLEDGIGYGRLESSMATYADAGLRVRAELTTFQSVALEVVAARDLTRLSGAMQSLGLRHGLRPPFITGNMPETRARIARAVLEAAGAEAYFAEAACG